MCICCCSVTKSHPTFCDIMDYSTPGFPVLHHLPVLSQTDIHCVCNAIWQSYPLLSSCLQSFPASGSFLMTQLLASDGQSIGVLEFQLQHQSLQWIFRVDFFRTDWLDLLAVWGTLNSLFQHHNLKASILQLSASLWFNSHIRTLLLEKP